MGEWDELESRLRDLGEEAARLVDDPLDPAKVRRLADRRRLRRSVAAVLIAVVILVSGGVGVYAVTSQPERHTPSPVGDPTHTPTPSPEPSEEISARGERIPSATSGPRGGRQTVPPTYPPNNSYSPDPTPESPAPSESPSPSPSKTSAEPEPEPTSTWTEDPDAHPTSEPTSGGGGGGGSTQTAPPPSDETAGG